MRAGILAPHVGFNANADVIRDVAQAAEALGYDSIWTADHVIIPASHDSTYPFSADGDLGVSGEQPYFEMLTTLGFLSAATEKVKLGVAVAVIPYRQPVLFAKAVATIDQLSKGRFILGAGTGWLAEEFAALGVDFASRGRATDEILHFLRSAWSTRQPVSHDGETFTLAPSYFAPGSFNDRHIPVWIGGDSKAAMRRVVEHDGWFPHLYGTPPDSIRRRLDDVGKRRVDLGRDPDVDVALFLPVALQDKPNADLSEPWRSRRLEGTPAQVRSVIERYRDAGVTEVLLMFGGGVQRRIDLMTVLRDEVIGDL
jgi:probable F420-dependent oxidoreductase